MNRCAIRPTASRTSRARWTLITHLGGTGPSMIAAGLPWFACCELHHASALALASVIVSHLAVQLVKRTVGRHRPAAGLGYVALVREPDRFSFPSGHATASMSVALAYSTVFPQLALPLLGLSLLVGFSRIRLAVHYPSDVLVGQVLAATTVSILATLL
jgi:undecaprenyl-diphosphatase